MTVSTCGLPAGIRSLAGEKLQLGLAVSLNAADDETRMRVMPRARPIRAVLAACRYYQEKTKRRITFEYVLCQEVNSGAGHARRLSNLLRGFDCLVNVIPFNPHPLVSIPASASPTADQIGGFRDLLEKLGLHVTVRFRKGRDIRAACGQLAAGGLRKPGALPPPPPRGRGRPLRGNR
jgi:23S rRNA (adenine2503-C2)-methyltransferase